MAWHRKSFSRRKEKRKMSSFSFDLTDFFNPPDKYYPVYTWMWNDALSKEEIKNQLDRMYERRIRGVYVVPLPSSFRPDTMVTALEPDYLSDGYFEMLSFYSLEQ